ncbi:hypothetical protein GNI_098970 [Gregarina niphandrodes]|uniref:Uncharacterized protein n=1 Tax=Gregarina niphandrodes TaxID=110365 RepID=A0A023B4Q2_GRENI|nr:hypothetical protein GNI_098970 [Gregarina niphandrodes]EZG57182.1 hypothetical protein GNI_098970 [Gregarina niphandrodes]|eukprot:XP_011131087.1 hypothetical protein GNI_098970 [Gregarina niphandrodes]
MRTQFLVLAIGTHGLVSSNANDGRLGPDHDVAMLNLIGSKDVLVPDVLGQDVLEVADVAAQSSSNEVSDSIEGGELVSHESTGKNEKSTGKNEESTGKNEKSTVAGTPSVFWAPDVPVDATWEAIRGMSDPDGICELLDKGVWPGVRCWRDATTKKIIKNSGAFGMGVRITIMNPSSELWKISHPSDTVPDYDLFVDCALRAKNTTENKQNLPEGYVFPQDKYHLIPECGQDNLIPTEERSVSVFWKLVKKTATISTAKFEQQLEELKGEQIKGRILANAGYIPSVYAMYRRHTDPETGRTEMKAHPIMNGFLMEFAPGTTFAMVHDFPRKDIDDMAGVVQQQQRNTKVLEQEVMPALLTTAIQHVKHMISSSYSLWVFFEDLWSRGVFHCDGHSENIMLQFGEESEGWRTDYSPGEFSLSGWWTQGLSNATIATLRLTEARRERLSTRTLSYDIQKWVLIDPAFALTLGILEKGPTDVIHMDNVCLQYYEDREEDINNVFGMQTLTMLRLAELKLGLWQNEAIYRKALTASAAGLSLKRQLFWESEFYRIFEDVMEIDEWLYRLSLLPASRRCFGERHVFQDLKAYAHMGADIWRNLYTGARGFTKVAGGAAWGDVYPKCTIQDALQIARVNVLYFAKQQQRLQQNFGRLNPDIPVGKDIMAFWPNLSTENEKELATQDRRTHDRRGKEIKNLEPEAQLIKLRNIKYDQVDEVFSYRYSSKVC